MKSSIANFCLYNIWSGMQPKKFLLGGGDGDAWSKLVFPTNCWLTLEILEIILRDAPYVSQV
jgi:hypothetical protein